MTPSIGHKLALISEVVTSNTVSSPIRSRVVTSLTEDRGSWHATTVKGKSHQGLQKITKDRAKYKLKTADLTKKYKDKFRQTARKRNTTVSEAMLSSAPESTYLVKQVEQQLGNLRFSDSKSG